MNIDQTKAVAFTGHRAITNTTDAELSEKIYRTIDKLYTKGYTTFLNGMAQGFDLLTAEVVWQYRNDKQADIRLIAVIPFRTQYARFSPEDKHRYFRIAQIAECVILSENYYQGCFHRRNEYLINNASTVVAYFDGNPKGGTFYTVSTANRKQLTVINLF